MAAPLTETSRWVDTARATIWTPAPLCGPIRLRSDDFH